MEYPMINMEASGSRIKECVIRSGYTTKEITEYIGDTNTATWFNETQKRRQNGEIVTSELIYYWMIALNVPVEFQKWHINRLLTLIKVCELKQEAPKKMSQAEIAKQHRELNAARRKATHSRG